MPKEFEIHIKFDGFLTRYDLNEIISELDKQVEGLVQERKEFHKYVRPRLFEIAGISEPRLTYFGIKSVRQGSIILKTVISSAVIGYAGKHFAKGINKSILPEELEELARIIGDIIGEHISLINERLEKYLNNMREKKRNVTALEVATPIKVFAYA